MWRMQMIMFNRPDILHAFLAHLTEALITYCSYQIKSGAQVGLQALAAPRLILTPLRCS